MISSNTSQEANVAALSPTISDSEYPRCGYDIDDLNNTNPRFTCIFCFLIVRDPIQLTECGHRACRECFDIRAAKTADGNIACPSADCDHQITNKTKVGISSCRSYVLCSLFERSCRTKHSNAN